MILAYTSINVNIFQIAKHLLGEIKINESESIGGERRKDGSGERIKTKTRRSK